MRIGVRRCLSSIHDENQYIPASIELFSGMPKQKLQCQTSTTLERKSLLSITKKVFFCFSAEASESRHNNPRKGSKHVVAKLIFRSSVREIAPRTRDFLIDSSTFRSV